MVFPLRTEYISVPLWRFIPPQAGRTQSESACPLYAEHPVRASLGQGAESEFDHVFFGLFGFSQKKVATSKIGDVKIPALEQKGDLIGIDLIVFGFAAVDSFHV